MKVVSALILSIVLSFNFFANDGVYLTRGGIIYPIKESKISLEKEVLSFRINDKVCQVNIIFEFNNPENVEKKLLIGFQAPSAVGDVPDEVSNSNQIKNFKIVANGQVVPYFIKAAECKNCELKEPEKFHFTQASQGVFVYLFELSFKPGINKINHSYSFPASTNVAIDEFYNYILTTGSKWAGGTIKDLTVNFDLGHNKYFYVSNIFGKKANWSVIGSGKVTGKMFGYREDSCRMVRILSGSLQITVKDFKPKSNIEFGIICEDSFVSDPTDFEKLKEQKVFGICGLALHPNEKYSKEKLRILKNTVYAQHGYSFKNIELKAYFSQFEWYIPEPGLTLDQLKLSQKEKIFIEEILKREKE